MFNFTINYEQQDQTTKRWFYKSHDKVKAWTPWGAIRKFKKSFKAPIQLRIIRNWKAECKGISGFGNFK